MSGIATQGNQILVDNPDDGQPVAAYSQRGQALVSWVTERVKRWEEQRNRGYQRLWGEYWRMWRGKWSEEDRSRLSERSRLIAPALAQAIEMTVSEIEEAVFSKEVWFDVVDDIADQDKISALLARDQLIEDLDHVGAKDALAEAVLNSAIFGTGVVKVNVYVGRQERPVYNRGEGRVKRTGNDRVYVCIESIRPDEFIPDPSGRTVQEMLGCAHRARKPLHSILEKIEQGVYLSSATAVLRPQQRTENTDIDQNDPQSQLSAADADDCDVVEYHGKVPLALLNAAMQDKTPLDSVLGADAARNDDGKMVEAIVTIANDGVLLRATVNPFVMQDRCIIAFPFEKVPGRFWGRGVAEKGYNPQKALDAEMRARADALGFVSAPMLGVDSGRIPRGSKFEVRPGKVWLTQGPPSEVLQPITIGDINANTFNQTSELERMVQMGTGAFDTASALKSQSASGSNSLSANSMMMGAFVKRAKRAIRNVDQQLLTPAIQKCLWRYMQFDSRRYDTDYEFRVKATMGIIAREVEAMQMTQLIGMLPEQYAPVALTLVQGIIEHSTTANKAQILQQINQLMQPPPPEVQEKQKQLADLQFEAALAQAQGELLKNQKTIAEIRKLLAEAQAAARKGDVEDDKLLQEQQRIALQGQEIEAFFEQNEIARKRLELQDKQLQIKARESAAKKSDS